MAQDAVRSGDIDTSAARQQASEVATAGSELTVIGQPVVPDSVGPSPGNGNSQAVVDGELARYYETALKYIDPSLTLESPLDEIVASATRRQTALRNPAREGSHEELDQLIEAVLFVRRTYAQLASHRPASVSQLAGNTHSEPGPASTGSTRGAAEPAIPRRNAPARRTPASPRTKLREAMAKAKENPQEYAHKPEDDAPAVASIRRPHGLEPLPEEAAWPVAKGLALITWQAWLALFAGWTATRFFVWPRPGIGYELHWLAATGLVALGIAVAIGVALPVRRYRLNTHRLSLLVHLSAVMIMLNTAAWWLAAGKDAVLDGPGWSMAVLIAAGWLVCAIAAWLNDARIQHRGERRKDRLR